MKKVIVINGSPRKDCNTAKALKEAKRGAEAAGAEVEFVNLVDLNFKGCMSCFACKVKGAKTNGLCAWKDDLRPVFEKILNADAVIAGSPIYWSYPTGMFRNFMERLLFAAGSYMKDEVTFFKRQIKRTIPFGIIYTMNVDENGYKQFNYPAILAPNEAYLRLLFGYSETLNIFDTFQFTDYSKYDCDMFDPNHKADVRNNQFPKDLEKAFDLGKRLAEIN